MSFFSVFKSHFKNYELSSDKAEMFMNFLKLLNPNNCVITLNEYSEVASFIFLNFQLQFITNWNNLLKASLKWAQLIRSIKVQVSISYPVALTVLS